LSLLGGRVSNKIGLCATEFESYPAGLDMVLPFPESSKPVLSTGHLLCAAWGYIAYRSREEGLAWRSVWRALRL
jgi:hypothetical protein